MWCVTRHCQLQNVKDFTKSCAQTRHVETMQLTEVPLLVEHISSVLTSIKNSHINLREKHAKQRHGQDPGRTQDVIAPTFYFFAVCKSLDELANSTQILECMKEKRLVLAEAEYVVEHGAFISSLPNGISYLVKAAQAFSLLAANEDFARDYKSHLTSENSSTIDSASFLKLKERLLDVVLAHDLELRPELRPFQDLLSRVRRGAKWQVFHELWLAVITKFIFWHVLTIYHKLNFWIAEFGGFVLGVVNLLS